MNSRISTLRPSQVGRLNERQVLRVIQAHGPLSRAEAVRRSGLSAPTVSKAVATLLAAGLLEESAAPGLARGRPAPKLRLASERAQVLGVVSDAGHCEVVSAGLDGAIHADPDSAVASPPAYPALLTAQIDRCRKLMAKPGVTTLGVGVSFPGLTDARTGRGVLSPNVPATNGHAPAADLGERLGLTAVPIQESHALCLAERHYGLAVGMDDFAMLDVSTGVGLGVMSGGRQLAGHGGMAGEIGHVTAVADGGRPCGCGNMGCLETVASDSALAWRVSRRLGRELTVEDVVELAKSGRESIGEELRETARYVGIAVAATVNLFNPATVFVHSLLFEADPGLFDRIVEEARGRALPPSWADCRVVRAKGNKRQGAVAGIVQHLTNAVAPGLSHL